MARKTIFHSLLGELEQRIGRLPAGTILPAEQTLADEYGVSKPTLRRALAELAEHGLIAKENGIGSVVIGARSAMRRELIFLCNNLNFYSTTLSTFAARVRQENYFLSIVPLDGDAFTQEQIIRTAIEQSPYGIAVSADQTHNDLPIYRELASGPIPTVFLCRLPGGVESGSLAIIDNRREFCRIVQHLYREGCRRFAFFTDIPPSVEVVQERFAGFLDGMRRCRLKPQETLLCLHPEQQQEFLLRFTGPGAPDAVCCHNDRSALELMKLLRIKGIDYSNIRFTGYDNLSLLRFLPQKLLTAELPLAELGKAAAEILLRQIENRSFKPVCKRLPARIKES